MLNAGVRWRWAALAIALGWGTVGLAATTTRATATRPSDLTVEDFFRPPQVRDALLNPAGTHLAMLVHDPKIDARSLTIIEIGTGKASGLRGSREFDVYSFDWLDNERIAFSISLDRRYAFGLYAIHRDKPQSFTAINRRDLIEVLGQPRARPNNLIVWIRDSARAETEEGGPEGFLELDVRVDQSDANSEDANIVSQIPDPPGDRILGGLCDAEGELRYAVTHQGTSVALFRREGSAWKPTEVNLLRFRPLAVDADPNCLLVAHTNAKGGCDLVRLNTVDRSVSEPIHTDQRYSFDVAKALIFADKLVGISYHREAPVQVWFGPEDQERQQLIDAILPNRTNLIVHQAHNRVLLRSSSERHHGELLVVDTDTKTFRRISDFAPWLPESLLAPVHHATFRTRDGLQLDAYLTYPRDHDPKKPAPLIVLPHGGPWVRDTLSFDPEAQFYASRGYVVFQPNYRGSLGYGPAISRRHAFEFRMMHDDVTDGVKMLIKYGVADPRRIAIVGGSFGGYLAVCGAAFEPDLYRCAVTIAGVFDWQRLLRDWDMPITGYTRQLMLKNLGNPKESRARFAELSPLNSVSRIKIPIFVAHGKSDIIADVAQSQQLVESLKEHHVPHETLFLRNTGHNFSRIENRVELYTRIEAFLKKNLCATAGRGFPAAEAALR